MAIRDLVTEGFGNGTFSGTIARVVTLGFSIGAAVTQLIRGTSKWYSRSNS